MRIKVSALLPIVALAGGCASTGSTVDATDQPLYMRMSDEDVRLADSTVQRALETQQSGVTLSWRNPTTGHYGTVTPERTYRAASGTYCRAYREQLSVDQRSATYTDDACRNPDGVWIPI